VDISSFLNEGQNTLAVLVWYFGKDGFSHKSSGKAGLLFQGKINKKWILSDKSWMTAIHPSYESTGNHIQTSDSRSPISGMMPATV
jgi:alpha-L-rhamnosidase